MAPIKTPTVILIPTTDLEVVVIQIFQLFFPESNPGLLVYHPPLVFYLVTGAVYIKLRSVIKTP